MLLGFFYYICMQLMILKSACIGPSSWLGLVGSTICLHFRLIGWGNKRWFQHWDPFKDKLSRSDIPKNGKFKVSFLFEKSHFESTLHRGAVLGQYGYHLGYTDCQNIFIYLFIYYWALPSHIALYPTFGSFTLLEPVSH